MSQIAIKLINQNKDAYARGENATFLDLGKTGLTSLPLKLFECTWLETLTVSNRYWDQQQKVWIESSNQGSDNLLNFIPTEIRYWNTKLWQSLKVSS